MDKCPDSDTSQMEVDSEDGDEKVITGKTLDRSAATAKELPAALRFTTQLTFIMLSHTLCHLLRHPSQYATQTLNPYNTIMLTFLATILHEPSARSAYEDENMHVDGEPSDDDEGVA